jgi:hypothetical protein
MGAVKEHQHWELSRDEFADGAHRLVLLALDEAGAKPLD